MYVGWFHMYILHITVLFLGGKCHKKIRHNLLYVSRFLYVLIDCWRGKNGTSPDGGAVSLFHAQNSINMKGIQKIINLAIVPMGENRYRRLNMRSQTLRTYIILKSPVYFVEIVHLSTRLTTIITTNFPLIMTHT
jgi:hypothetical protein